MSILSLEEKEHIALYLAALTDFSRAPLTSHVQSNPQCSRDLAQVTGNKHTSLTLLRVTVQGIRIVDCGPVVIVISPVLLIASTSDQGPDGIYPFQIKVV